MAIHAGDTVLVHPALLERTPGVDLLPLLAVGIDLGTPVVEAIGAEAKSRFSGKIVKITIETRAAKPAEKAQDSRARTEVAQKKAKLD
ncbi:MAG: hypothetical protein IPK39_06105 [Sulfuritalea sp.]|nr:hypothetical protein [Sulfuritalea sp.]